MMTRDPSSSAGDTAADDQRSHVISLLFGLAAGPAAWVAQLIANYALSSEACYPADQPHQVAPPPGWAGEHLVLAAVNLACLVLALVGFAIARSNRRRFRDAPDSEYPAEIRAGRARFLARCGLYSASVFGAAILFDAVAIWLVPSCWSIP